MGQGKHVAGGAQLPIRFRGSRPNNKAKAPYTGPWDTVAALDGATKAVFEGLTGAPAGRKVHAALRGYVDKIWGQGKDNGGTGIVVTQEEDDQIPGYKAPKRQQASGQQAAQETGKAAYHPAYWGDGKRGGSWDVNSQDLSLEGKEDDPHAPP